MGKESTSSRALGHGTDVELAKIRQSEVDLRLATQHHALELIQVRGRTREARKVSWGRNGPVVTRKPLGHDGHIPGNIQEEHIRTQLEIVFENEVVDTAAGLDG